MKKIGIVTIIGDYNYGNRLQNYALYKILEEFGNNVETINFRYVDKKIFNKFKYFIRGIIVSIGIGRFRRYKNFKSLIS